MFVYVVFQQSTIAKEFKCVIRGIYRKERDAIDCCKKFNASRAINVEFDEYFCCQKYGHLIKDFSEYVYYYIECIEIIK